MSSFTKKHSSLVKSGLANMCAIYNEVIRKKNPKIPKTGSELNEMLSLEIFGEDEHQTEPEEVSKTKLESEESESESESEEEDDGRFPDGWMDSAYIVVVFRSRR